MKREEVIEHLTDLGAWDSYSHQNMVACINQLVEQYENRSCESCKYYISDRRKEIKKCSKLELRTFKDFYCKYWEAKE